MPDHGPREDSHEHATTIGGQAGSTATSFSQSLDWDREVCSATARLNEGWVLAETRCHPAIAEELAALLCAYHERA